MIATDGVRPVPSSVVGLREVTLGEMISLSAEVVGQALDRILDEGRAVSKEQAGAFFASSI